MIRPDRGDENRCRHTPSSDATAAAHSEPRPMTPTSVFRKEGEYWTLTFAGTTVHLRDSVGLQYLARLLVSPDHRIDAGDLVTMLTGHAADAVRARSAVSKRIRAAIEKIAVHHDALGHHLSTTVKTGTRCGYFPDPHQPTNWAT